MPSHAEAGRHRSIVPPSCRSVNLAHDHASEATPPFIVTACARRAIQQISLGLSAMSRSRAWTLTGPYGTGKSSFALFLARLLASRASAASTSAWERLRAADPVLASGLPLGDRTAKGLVPIVITGAREPVAAALARGLAAAVAESGVRGARRLAEDIRSTLSEGRRDPLEVLELAASTLVAGGAAGGLLIVIDELGKLLEYAAAHPDKSDVYLLQRLAEHAGRSAVPTLVIGILHQDFAGYAGALTQAQRTEWEKVRGRFEDVVFEQSADDMLRLIAEAMSGHSRVAPATGAHGREFKAIAEGAWEVDVAPPGLGRPQGSPLLQACHPLHPCVSLLLGPVFKRCGQNERSAFSFLSSGEPHALVDFAARSRPGELFMLADLHQYLVGAFGDSLLASKDGKRWAEAFNVERQHPDLASGELLLLRTAAILGIVGRWNGIAPSPDVLRYALHPVLTAAEVKAATAALLARSAIVYRRFNDTFSLWEGSDIDVDARIANARSQVSANASTFQLLHAHFTPRPVVARRHSYESGTLRYFEVVFCTPDALAATLARFEASVAQGVAADGQIVVLLPDSGGVPLDARDTAIQPLNARADVLLCLPANAREVDALARELAAIQFVRRVTPELQSDATARRELAAREEAVRQRLEEDIVNILAPSGAEAPRTRWYRMGAEERVESPRALNELLSAICSEIYDAAPVIQNEIINRRQLSSSAAAAQGRLIAQMLTHAAEPGLGIEGNPPERSIYLSVLRPLKLHREHDGHWVLSTSERSLRKDARPLFKAIRDFFDSAEDAPRSLDALFSVLRGAPFGLRAGVIPIFVCAALIGNESDVALYEGGAFLPQLTPAIFEKLVKDPGRYAVRRWHVSGVRVGVFEHLARMLGQTPAAAAAEPRDLLDIVKPLLRFVRNLNPFALHTKMFAPLTVAVRGAIANASEPDQLLFAELPRACGVEPFAASRKDRTRDVTRYLRALQSALAELRQGYNALLQGLVEELAASLDESRPECARPNLARRARAIAALALNADIKVFAARLADADAGEPDWVEQVAAYLASKHPANWHDEDRGRFTVRLGQMAEAFRALESILHSRAGVHADEGGLESIRISIVGTRAPRADEVVHLDGGEARSVDALQARVLELCQPLAANGSRKLVLAALARVAHAVVNKGVVAHLEGAVVHE